MTPLRSRPRTGHDAPSWPVLLLLLTVVLVPTAGVLWFMSQAMHNEQLAVRQRLRDAYQSRLVDVQQALDRAWQRRSEALDNPPDAPGDGAETRADPSVGARAFAMRTRAEMADSFVVYDAAGRPAYPAPPRPPTVDPLQPSIRWQNAERLEHAGEHEAAAAGYAAIAAQTEDPGQAARALQAQARCLVRADSMREAIAILADAIGDSAYRDVTDEQGRLIAPSALLRALELLAGDDGPGKDQDRRRIAATLLERLLDYGAPEMPAGQRRFLLQELIDSSADLTELDTTWAPARVMLEAETLAARYLGSQAQAPSAATIRPAGLPEVWHLASPSGRITALFSQQYLTRSFASFLDTQILPEDTVVELFAPGTEPEGPFLVSHPAGRWLQDWQLVLRPVDPTLFAAAASQRIHGYLLIGGLVILAIFTLAILVGRMVGRQLRLTRLKNDLLATVSHELKTPLASTRLLVDTLLETGVDDTQRVREYLSLIAKENARLSRLVDNFLTFSRMEKNRQQFDLQRIPARGVLEAASESFGDRLQGSEQQGFTVEIAPNLPLLDADPDALETVLLNLLDNAHKYADAPRRIVLRGYRENGTVCLAVQDNGIGIASRAIGKIFDRFYQADQSLSRPASGCGLGLSIVARIVRAHHGTVTVDSRPGEGSTFTVRVPAAPEGTEGSEEPGPKGPVPEEQA